MGLFNLKQFREHIFHSKKKKSPTSEQLTCAWTRGNGVCVHLYKCEVREQRQEPGGMSQDSSNTGSQQREHCPPVSSSHSRLWARGLNPSAICRSLRLWESPCSAVSTQQMLQHERKLPPVRPSMTRSQRE